MSIKIVMEEKQFIFVWIVSFHNNLARGDVICYEKAICPY